MINNKLPITNNRLVIIFLFIIFSLTIWFTSMPIVSYAQPDFSLGFTVEYKFDEQGNANVTKRITLTNLNTDTYPSVYLVDVPDDASDIAAVNETGKLETQTLEEGGRRMVRILLPVQKVGENEKTNITLSFETRTLAVKQIEAWQIGIPPFSTDERIISYNTTITTPKLWGEPSYKAPESAKPYTWTLNERGEDPIVLVFGTLYPTDTETKANDSANKTIISIGVIAGIVITILLFILYSKKHNNNYS